MISGMMHRNPFFVPPDQLLEEMRGRRSGPRLLETGILTENRKFRYAIRDLMALSSMPATWIGREPGQVAKQTLRMLQTCLHLDAAYMRLKRGDGSAVDVLQAEKWPSFSEWVNSLDARRQKTEGIPEPRKIELPAGDGVLNVIQIPIGIDMEAGCIVVGSTRPDFPTEIDTMVLSVAANQGMASFQNSRLLHEHERVETQLEILKEEVDNRPTFENIKGSSPALKEVLSRIAKVAPTNSTVLITGATGTGKELVATAIHRHSRRAKQPFVSVNCAALAPGLIASELFGHEKGSFTGAVQRRLGRFELAHGGTIFLDEVGELPLDTQVALLRVLQERVIVRVGGTQPIAVNVRVLTATNRDLQATVASGAFRADLFYRLNVFPIEVPALRDRREDIPALVRHFVQVHAKELGKKISSIDQETMRMLQAYQWPGNIRELQNIVERSLILSEGETLSVDAAWLNVNTPHDTSGSLLQKLVEREREIVESALAESNGKVSGAKGAASRLGIPPTTLESRIKALGINKNRFK
jgi:transcriptional regulator with GAF, ATPase, and Fis domain